MSPKKRALMYLGLFSIVVGVIFFYTSLYEVEEKESNTKVVIAVSQTPLSAPFFVAKRLGYFQDEGLDVILIPCDGGVACTEMMLNSEVDYATASESVLMFQSFKHHDLSLLASFAESYNDLKLLTLEPLNIRSVKDLEGKKIGVIKGSASEFYFDSVLISNNLKSLNLEKVYLEPSDLVPALLSYRVDAISSWEPMGYKADVLSATKVLNLGNSSIYQLSFNLLALKKHLEQATDDEPVRVLKALDSAVDWINSNPDVAMKSVATSLNLSVDQVAWSWKDLLFRVSLGNALFSNIQLQARWATERGLVENDPPDFREVFYPNPFRQLVASRD